MNISVAWNNEHAAAYKRDAELVKQTLKGDNASFAQLMSLYKKRIFSLGMSFFKNSDDTEDVIQDVFLKAYTKLASFRKESLFSTWLTRIAYNQAINAVNRRKEYVSIADESIIEYEGDTPEEVQIKKITKAAIRDAIKELPKNYTVCLDMYFFLDIPYNEISEITGFPINTIKSHIFRAKKILRDKLADEGLI